MSQHLIHRQILNVNYSNEQIAKSDLGKWEERNEKIFAPWICEVLDELEIPERTIRIPSLSIHFGISSGQENWDILKEKFKETLKANILEQAPELKSWHSSSKKEQNTSTSLLSDEKNEAELLIYLLAHGRQPWWAGHSKNFKIHDLVKRLMESSNLHFRMVLEKRELSQVMLSRLVSHLTFRELLKLIFWIYPTQKTGLENLIERLEISLSLDFIPKKELSQTLGMTIVLAAFTQETSSESSLVNKIHQGFFKNPGITRISEQLLADILFLVFIQKQEYLPKGKNIQQILVKWASKAGGFIDFQKWWESTFQEKTSEELIHTYQEIAKTEVIRTEISKKKKQGIQAKPVDLKQDESILISNAGLILTASFLPHFFRDLGLVLKKDFTSEEAQNRAVLLLQSLLGDEGPYEESDLILNKILCGNDLDKAIPLDFSPTEKEIESSQHLLESMVGHWTALKSTSAKTMANSFFPREGILKKTDKGYHLFINRSSIDILLNRLPWTISITKLPWMQDILYTEW